MEATGEQFGEAFGGIADDAGGRLPRPGRLHTVPGGAGTDPRPPLPPTPGASVALNELARKLAAELAGTAVAAPDLLAGATYAEAADFADGVEDLSRTVEYLQILCAGALDRTRAQATTDTATATARAARACPAPVVFSPADDGCRNTAEFLRLRLRIPIREARRRLTLAQNTLPGTTLTGQPLPPARPHLATALTPATEPLPSGDAHQNTHVKPPALSSCAATLITVTLDRLQHHTSPETLRRIEHHLTAAAATTDPDFLARLAQRWTDTIDANGTEPTEEALRHTQGAFIRKPRHGLHHLEIFATTDQYEHLLTVMNTATNPRTATSGTDLDRRTRAQKQLDGLITAAKTALATNTLPTTGGNRPQIIATIYYQDLFPTHNPGDNTAPHTEPTTTEPATTNGTGTGTEHGTPAGTGTFAFTGPVAAATLRKIACDADIIPALLGTHGEILDLGRKTRLFTPAQRTALTARDQGCAFPNCTIPAPWCEAHHITYWSRHGPTTTNNGVLLCSHHHLIHKENWTITTTHNTPKFIPPPHIDPTQTPQQNHYFKPPPPPHQQAKHEAPQPVLSRAGGSPSPAEVVRPTTRACP
ncbi:DUF222 domain-containing protein [Pseudarthrobacter sp. YAF2]|uniref:HNH endonuclease signature motif containing protein n=1 Tax=Pseudarthrobacter sp. YAF2 TaxID=3233078 RepID=UPI003F9810B3